MNLKSKNSNSLRVNLALFLLVLITSCSHPDSGNQKYSGRNEQALSISEHEVSIAQQAWGAGIVRIGKVYLDGGDYKAEAAQHIHKFYNYSEGTVLFKPTLAAEKQFRTDFAGALSYFVAGNKDYPEDHGFALKPWSRVRWENKGTYISGNMAVAMGNYFFTPGEGGKEVKVEYSFAFIKNKKEELKIVLHGSHLPYVIEK